MDKVQTDARLRWERGEWRTLARVASDIVFGGESGWEQVAPSYLAHHLRRAYASRSHRNVGIPTFVFRRLRYRWRRLKRRLPSRALHEGGDDEG